MKWKDDMSNELDKIFIARINNQSIETNSCCNKPELHIYAHKWDDKFSSGWIWCSQCKKYSHLDGIKLPNNWNNCELIDVDKLCAVPIYLEQNKNIIDVFMVGALDEKSLRL